MDKGVMEDIRRAGGSIQLSPDSGKKEDGRSSANGLLTDLYQLTMAAGYFEAGKTQDRATFELFVRRLPHNRNFILAAGLAQAVEYLLNFRFTAEEIAYLRGTAAVRAYQPALLRHAGRIALHRRRVRGSRKALRYSRASRS